MNPEFQRNLWLNFSTGRLIMMPAILGAIFFAVSLVPEDFEDMSLRATAEFLFVLIVIFWGTRLAARAVVGEIRDRTWDGQRMSAIAPWSMVWGKLLGSTIYVWYGGAICLALIVFTHLPDLGRALYDIAFWLSIGIFSHAIAMLTSLLAVRRDSKHMRLEVFAYQFAGLVGAWFAASLWPSRVWQDFGLEGAIPDIQWFGIGLEADLFFLLSIAAFVIWGIIGNHRLMRQELQFQNSPLVWIAFLVFMMAYVAGLADNFQLEADLTFQTRLYLAGAMASLLTYAMIFLDTKDPVLLRWIGGRFVSGSVFAAIGRLPSWFWSLGAAGVMAVLLVLFGDTIPIPDGDLDFDVQEEQELGWLVDLMAAIRQDGFFAPAALVVAAFFFIVRDVGIFLFFNAGRRLSRRGDFAALVVIFVLYVILPSIVTGMGWSQAIGWFGPFPADPQWMAVVPPLVEAVFVLTFAFIRIARVRRTVPAPA